MRWEIHCAINTVKAILPFQAQLRTLKRSWAGYVTDSAKDLATIEHGLEQIDLIRQQFSLQGRTIVEVGTGWEPIIPILFSLAGASRVYMTDTIRLCAPATLKGAISSLCKHKDLVCSRLRISAIEFDVCLAVNPAHFDEACAQLRIGYLAPCDCRRLPFEDASIDVITSHMVLEHIAPEIIADIYAESSRVLRSGGLMCHVIDNSDHWQHRDARISALNFLRYPEWVFKLTCINDLDYQNRLRHSEHMMIMTDRGFEILFANRDVDQRSLQALSAMRLDEKFAKFKADDLATLTSTVLARKSNALGGTCQAV
jgi:SAM-dependent methyltransferase